jgi:UDP-2,4-diacetamido-2,4,6-trideoxy-beta-L-altropyranose hydrolase
LAWFAPELQLLFKSTKAKIEKDLDSAPLGTVCYRCLVEQTIIIRVDSSLRIGTGHVVRCIRIAEELESKGAKVVFLCADLPGNISRSISKLGFCLELFEPPVNEEFLQSIESPWPPKAQMVDASRTLESARSKSSELVVVDQYALSELWEEKLALGGCRVVALDDLDGKRHVSEMLIRPGVSFATPPRRDLNDKHRELSGLRYAIVPREFCEAKNYRGRLRDSANRKILVYFGGIDRDNASEQVVDAIIRKHIEGSSVELVLGSGNNRLEVLKKKYMENPEIQVHSSLNSLAELVAQCDIAIGAGGVSAFERAAAALPTFLFSVSENQISVCRELDARGLAKYAGSFDEFDSEVFAGQFSEYLEAVPEFVGLSDTLNVFDCLGAKRLAELIHPSQPESLKIRHASELDLSTYFSWVNDPLVRGNSLNSNKVTFPSHREWFLKSLSNPDVLMLLFELDSLPVAQVRFTIEEGNWNINYSLDEVVRGRGWGKSVVQSAVTWLRLNRDSRPITAVVKSTNLASIGALTASGFASPETESSSDTFKLYRY